MNKGKAIRWALLTLFVVACALFPLFEHFYQVKRHAGWSTYFPTKWNECDLGYANIFPDDLGRVWVLGTGKCEFFTQAHIFDGNAWEELDLDWKTLDRFLVDGQGQLWRMRPQVGEKGRILSVQIDRYSEGKWTQIFKANSQWLDECYRDPQLAFDKQGRPWLIFLHLPQENQPGTATTAVMFHDGKVWNIFTRNITSALAGDRFSGPLFDKQGKAWFWSERHGLRVYDGNKWMVLSDVSLNLDKYGSVVSLALDAGGNPWMATSNSYLVAVDGSQEIYLKNAPGLPEKVFIFEDNFQFAFDPLNRIWITFFTNSKQISVLDGGTWKVMNEKNTPLPRFSNNKLVIDGQGNAWVGTPTGFHVFHPGQGEITLMKPTAPWIQLRGNEHRLIGWYWLLPFLLFAAWFALLFPKGRRAAALGLLFVVCEGLLLLLVYLTKFQSGLLIIPFGAVGLFIGLIASDGIGRQGIDDKKLRKQVRLGIALNAVGLVLGIGLLFLFLLLSVQ